MKRIVVASHTASYDDPIVLKAGDPVELTGREYLWDGHRWFWAEGPDGRTGWVPDGLAVSKDGRFYAGYDYCAVELSCRQGEVLLVVEETHGWAWCRSRGGDEGWVPLRTLSAPGI